MIERGRIPFALFNSKALFNPFQYLPFLKIFNYNTATQKWECNGKNLLIADEVGVGKTIEAGIIIRELKEIKKAEKDLTVLILCPVKLCKNWKNELWELFNISASNYRETKQFGQFSILPFSYFTYTNNISEQEISKDEVCSENLDNNEEINKEAIDNIIKNTGHIDLIIVDEAHYLRNNNGKLYNSVIRLFDKNKNINKEDYLKIFMTGTPIVNKESDIKNLKELLCDGGKAFETTNTRQGVANCYDFTPEITSLDIEYGENSPLSINRYLRDNSFGNLSMPLRRMAASSVYTLRSWLDTGTSSEEIIDSSDIASCDEEELKKLKKELKNELAEYDSEKDEKYEKLTAKIDEMFGGDDKKADDKKAIIFCFYKKTVEYLCEKLRNNNWTVFYITGDTSTGEVDKIKEDFRDCKDPAVLICTDAAKEGHNLQFCHNQIHYDYPFTAAAIAQRIGRVYRRGQKQNPQIVYMHVQDSYDDRMMQILLGKADLTEDKGIVPLSDLFPSNKPHGKLIIEWFKYRWATRLADGNAHDDIPLFSEKEEEGGNISDEQKNKALEYIARKTGIDLNKNRELFEEITEELRKMFNITKDGKKCYISKDVFYRTEAMEIIFADDNKVDRNAIYSKNVKEYLETEVIIKEQLFGVNTSQAMKDILTEAKQKQLNGKVCSTKFCDYMYETPPLQRSSNVNNSVMSLEDYKKQFKYIVKY